MGKRKYLIHLRKEYINMTEVSSRRINNFYALSLILSSTMKCTNFYLNPRRPFNPNAMKLLHKICKCLQIRHYFPTTPSWYQFIKRGIKMFMVSYYKNRFMMTLNRVYCCSGNGIFLLILLACWDITSNCRCHVLSIKHII